MMKLLRDTSGLAAAEYAMILLFIAIPMMLASLALKPSIGGAMDWTYTTDPAGKVYHCTANCRYDEQDYCLAINDHVNNLDQPAPVFSPALPASDKPQCGLSGVGPNG